MSILGELLEEIKDNPLPTQLKKICDKIFDEEKDDMTHLPLVPKGGNIFLSLEVNYKQKEISFLSLERDGPDEFIVVLLSRKNDNTVRPFKRVKTWDIKEDKPKKIMKKYASIYKYISEVK